MTNNGYKYHVFLSYKRARRKNGRIRDGDVEAWVTKFFEPELQAKLTHTLGESAEIFCDQFEIRAGDEWESTIVEALRSSFCLVSVWSPLYFSSGWCVCEWSSFRMRDQRLVVPVTWQTKISLPPAAQRVQCKDFNDFAYTADSFPKSEAYPKFEDLVKDFAQDVAKAVDRAPAFDPNREVVLPEQSIARRHSNTVALDNLPDRADLLLTQKPRIRRSNIVLAA